MHVHVDGLRWRLGLVVRLLLAVAWAAAAVRLLGLLGVVAALALRGTCHGH